MSEIADKIWTTYKSRMISERRYIAYDLASNIWISTYSALLIGTSIFSDEIVLCYPSFAKVNILLSVLVFALSLVLYGFQFKEKAARYRECYLKLQALYDKRDDVSDLAGAYNNIRENYANHSDRDYSDLLVESVIIRNRSIKDPAGNELRPGKLEICSYYLRKYSMLALTYVVPLGSLYGFLVFLWKL
ncbi:MAG: SLATT domain-containing protein [Magnetospirillum gryphiswaldense]|nr:SLATT domain-containing protein [Magnetospirillum gryphiswaldense]